MQLFRRFLQSGITLIISNEEIDDIMKIVKSLEDIGLTIQRFSKTIKNEAREQKERFFSMLLGALDASLLWNMLSVKGIIAPKEGKLTLRAGESTIRAGQIFRCCIIL